jgi:two-component system sensor histidine kinase YesM
MTTLRARHRWSLRRKLVLTSLLCLLLPSVLTLIASDYLTQRIVRSQAIDNERKSLELTDVYISSLFNNMIRVSNGIMFDIDINLALKEMWQRQRLDQMDPAQDAQDTKNIQSILNSIASTMDTVYVTISTEEGRLFTNYGFDLYGGQGSDAILDKPWMQQVKALSAFEVGWIGLVDQYTTTGQAVDRNLITMARNLRLPSKASYAYVIISISENQLSQIFRHDVGRQETMLLDGEGRILVSQDDSKIGKLFEFHEEVERAPDTISVSDEGEEFLLSRHDLNYGGYRVVSLRPYKEAVDQIHSVSRLSFTIQIAAVLLFLFLFVIMIRQFTKPVVKLGQVASLVEGGDLSVRSGVRGGDEIGHLGKTFDQMLERIEWMIGQITAEQMLKRKAELAMLQAQINPHFLFNILNSIRLRILMKGDEENAELLYSLSGLLRMTIYRKDEYTPLHDELDIVQKYIELLNFRQLEQATLIVDAATDSLSVLVPRFILQPVIENAYLHGLSQEGGEIRITVRRLANRLLLAIEDNGKGMQEETLNRLRTEMKSLRGPLPDDLSARLSGIGITNVYERLYLVYGDEFRLSLDSTPGRGTRIEIEFPATAPITGKKEG